MTKPECSTPSVLHLRSKAFSHKGILNQHMRVVHPEARGGSKLMRISFLLRYMVVEADSEYTVVDFNVFTR